MTDWGAASAMQLMAAREAEVQFGRRPSLRISHCADETSRHKRARTEA